MYRRILTALLAAFFLLSAHGIAMNVLAADWELWPRGRDKAAPPPAGTAGEEDTKPAAALPPGSEGAAKAGEAAGKSVSGGITAGTIGKAALIVGGIIAIGLAAGGGGGGGTTTPAHH